MNNPNFERFYDVLDESANILYEAHKMDYLTAILATINNIMEVNVSQNVDDTTYEQLMAIYQRLEDFEFKKEDIRKALQLCILKGFKHRKLLNGDMTPDTIAILMNYIVAKFYTNKTIKVLDPLVGTANLIATIANNSDNVMSFTGVDHSPEMINIAKGMMDLLDYAIDLYVQDTSGGVYGAYDLIISDLPDIAQNEQYLPSLVINTYLKNLKPDAPMICLIPNTFFDHTSKEAIMEFANLEGLIKLPNNIFKKGYEKSILILTRKGKRVNQNFLLLDIESITDREIVTSAMQKIDDFFKHY